MTFLSVAELAERWDVPESTIYGWRYKGTGPVGLKIGRHVRYPLAAVEAWEAEQRDQRPA
jgi:excisionase family DNA binding protein